MRRAPSALPARISGLTKYIELAVSPLQELEAVSDTCLLVTNPPYGERITSPDIFGLYADLGSFLKHKFTGNKTWSSALDDCLFKIGLKPSRKIELLNGALECLYCE